MIQGDLGQRRRLSKGQLSKETFFQGTLVQGDFSPRIHWSKESIVLSKVQVCAVLSDVSIIFVFTKSPGLTSNIWIFTNCSFYFEILLRKSFVELTKSFESHSSLSSDKAHFLESLRSLLVTLAVVHSRKGVHKIGIWVCWA